jgi:hypothetical protein
LEPRAANAHRPLNPERWVVAILPIESFKLNNKRDFLQLKPQGRCISATSIE